MSIRRSSFLPAVAVRPAARLGASALGVATLGLLAALLSAPAQAAPRTVNQALIANHASYVSSDPAANAVVKAAPAVVTIHFAEPVVPASSTIVIYDANGRVVSQAAQADTNDLKTMTAAMKGDGSEVYLVYWHTVSATDGDPDVGAFNFFVNASGVSDLAPKSAASSTASTTPASASGLPIWLTALIALVALLIGLVGGAAWARSRGNAGSR